jgi:dienelactone hydrolase
VKPSHDVGPASDDGRPLSDDVGPDVRRPSRARARVFGLAALLLFALVPGAASANGLTSVPAVNGTPAIPVYIARPRTEGRFPAVLLLHGCQGFNGFSAIAADRLAAHGYVAVALDSLGPASLYGACGGTVDGSIAEVADARATLAWMRTLPYTDPDRLAIVGGSMGGKALLDIIDPIGSAGVLPAGVRAAVAFYPSCDGRDGKTLVPLAIFDGDADQISPAPPCAAMVRAGTSAGKVLEITTYPGATHGFEVPGPERTFFGQPIRYDPEAAADAVQKTESFLAHYLN